MIINKVITGIATRNYENRLTYGKSYKGYLEKRLNYNSNINYYVFHFTCDQKMNTSVTLNSLQDKTWMNINFVSLNVNVEIL